MKNTGNKSIKISGCIKRGYGKKFLIWAPNKEARPGVKNMKNMKFLTGLVCNWILKILYSMFDKLLWNVL